jgi:small subunit ribosomal protein S9
MPAKIKKSKKKDYIYAVGRRKKSSARVRLFRGKGNNMVNGKSIEKYFPGSILKDVWSKPFKVVDVSDKYYMTAKVGGGGVKGQLDAVSHALARALAKANKDEFKPLLRKAGLLTTDPRQKERRKPGTGGKARRAKQSPKR